MIRAHHVGETSAFLGQTCALCKQEFAIDDDIVVCPADGSRHHVHCWRANGNKCTAYGCRGQGEVGRATLLRQPVQEPVRPRGRTRVIEQTPDRPPAARPIPDAPGSKVRTLPAGSFGCAQFCLLIAIAVAIVLMAIGCFGLWAIADYLMQEVWHLPYREPLSGAISLLSQLVTL